MLVVVSPAKKLDFEENFSSLPHSQPDFLDQSEELIEVARDLSREDIASLMKISDNLADLNYQRYRHFSRPFTLANAKQAVLAFKGDTYRGLDAETLSDDDMDYAQRHFRILSGLYGVLRPLDLIQPYRLEMGTKLANPSGKNLYEFWDQQITTSLNKALEDACGPSAQKVLVNCASQEYFKAVKPSALNGRVITPVFKEVKDGQARVLGMMAKKARGMMARYIIQQRIDIPEGLKDFDLDGYTFQPDLSDDNVLEFHRRMA
ncbi:MAG: peroxide stress protein YaaA [Kordiimonas sp.]|nr:peroxide stress protein YaaA [Kordiimonas sp.]|tara:strand:- start:1113 stop:1898 length:786 start_codon:yes stop_codon:yes gene_type:complete